MTEASDIKSAGRWAWLILPAALGAEFAKGVGDGGIGRMRVLIDKFDRLQSGRPKPATQSLLAGGLCGVIWRWLLQGPRLNLQEVPCVGSTLDGVLIGPDRPPQPTTVWLDVASNDRLQSGRPNPATQSLLTGGHGGAGALERALHLRLCLFSSL